SMPLYNYDGTLPIGGISMQCVLSFKAEDGIRYWSVTGVQTCALPISMSTNGDAEINANWHANERATTHAGRRVPGVRKKRSMPGSEERRVGKEWRSPGATCAFRKEQT